jgi:hypothetical protein
VLVRLDGIVAIATLLAGVAWGEDKPPLPEQPGSSIGYPSVEAALAALHARHDVSFSIENGWTIATDTATRTIWSFAPNGSPAYPTAVKRQVVEREGVVSINMDVLCGASKTACDDVVRTFRAINERAFSRR